jgi:hypothetical protein
MRSVRRFGGLAFVLCVAALMASACHRTVRPSAVHAAAEDFHRSDPAIIGTTGRPQLLEFFGPT